MILYVDRTKIERKKERKKERNKKTNGSVYRVAAQLKNKLTVQNVNTRLHTLKIWRDTFTDSTRLTTHLMFGCSTGPGSGSRGQ